MHTHPVHQCKHLQYKLVLSEIIPVFEYRHVGLIIRGTECQLAWHQVTLVTEKVRTDTTSLLQKAGGCGFDPKPQYTKDIKW